MEKFSLIFCNHKIKILLLINFMICIPKIQNKFNEIIQYQLINIKVILKKIKMRIKI